MEIDFRPTPSPSSQKRERQWLEVSEEIARQMHTMGLGGAVSLSPEISDVRSWQALGFRAEVRYTYILDLPYSIEDATNAVRKNIKKAARVGYLCEQSRDYSAILACIRETEVRQGFRYGLEEDDLRALHTGMGHEHCRMYLCRSSEGEAVSSRIVLHTPGGRALDWVAGTRTLDLHHGVTQQLIDFVLQDLTVAGAQQFDFGGANISSVARSKMEWGGILTPFYAIRPLGFRTLIQDARMVLHSGIRELRRQ
jgi:hypothetical protein